MSFVDLEAGLIDPYELADRLNALRMIEYVTHFIFAGGSLFSGHWIVAMINIPLIIYRLRQWRHRKIRIDIANALRLLKRYRLEDYCAMALYSIDLTFVLGFLMYVLLFDIWRSGLLEALPLVGRLFARGRKG